MSKKDLLLVIQKSLAEDRSRTPEDTFQRMVQERLIDADGHPVERERKLVFGDRTHEPDNQ